MRQIGGESNLGVETSRIRFNEGKTRPTAKSDSATSPASARAVARNVTSAISRRPLANHADPHARNLVMQTHKHVPLTLMLLDWNQAGRLVAPLRHALIALCLY